MTLKKMNAFHPLLTDFADSSDSTEGFRIGFLRTAHGAFGC
jgi:hypothetical protein